MFKLSHNYLDLNEPSRSFCRDLHTKKAPHPTARHKHMIVPDCGTHSWKNRCRLELGVRGVGRLMDRTIYPCPTWHVSCFAQTIVRRVKILCAKSKICIWGYLCYNWLYKSCGEYLTHKDHAYLDSLLYSVVQIST
jgi:hypothetical protein